nr:hypothetical protein [Tanacetum cinerariifolium]
MTTPAFAKTHNLIAYLAKPAESDGFKQIIDFLNGSSVRYALTTSPTIRTSCIKQFWSTAKVKTVNDEVRVQALIDEKRVNIKEFSIRRTLKLDDEEGTSCLANDDIFTGLANMGYEKMSDKLTFYKAFFSSQWKFLIHTILQYILLSLVKNIEVGVPFYMFPRFVQLLVDHQMGDMSHHQDIYDNPSLTKKVFANMKRVGTGFSSVITPLFENMLDPAVQEVGQAKDDKPKAPKVPSPEPLPEHQLPLPSIDPILDADKDNLKFQELMDLCTRLSNKVLDLESEVIDIKSSFTDMIQKLKDKVDQLEEENRALKEKSFKPIQVDTAAPVENMKKSSKQGRIIADMDEDVEVNLQEDQAKAYNLDSQHSKKVLSIQDIDEEEHAKVEEVPEVVTAAKLMTEVVTTATPTTTATQSKDKGKRILIEEPKPLKRQAHIDMDEAFARQLEAELNGNINWNDVIEQVKRSESQDNTVMSEIRPIFKKHYNSIQAFLEKVKEEVTVQEEGNKRQEAIPLASNVPVVDYQIHHENNKPYFKIIRADETHKLFLSFITLLKHFDREDLEDLWQLVKERFKTTKPKNFLDDFLLNILKIMFEKPNIKASVWKDQNGRYGLAKVKS